MSAGAAVVGRPVKKGMKGEKGERKFTVTYRVETTDREDGPKTALTANGLPDIGQSYSFGNETDSAICRSITATEVDDKDTLWTIVATFSNKSTGGGDEDNNDDQSGNDDDEGSPWDEALDFSKSTGHIAFPVEQDIWGRPIVNSNGNPFIPPHFRDFPFAVLTITRNEGVELLENYIRKRNADVVDLAYGGVGIVGARIGELLIFDGRAKVKFKRWAAQPDGQRYARVTYEILHIPTEPWGAHLMKVLDKGFDEMEDGEDGSDNNPENGGSVYTGTKVGKKAITDDAGRPVKVPALLDGAGHKLADGAKAVFLNYEIHESINFAPLDLTKNKP